MVNFKPLGPNSCEVSLKLNYDPEGAIEHIADATGMVSSRVGRDLDRFKEYIETRQIPTGSWRGEIHGKEITARDPGDRAAL
jgi:uncharacterized membrane protein